jgi:hypothetical protein
MVNVGKSQGFGKSQKGQCVVNKGLATKAIPSQSNTMEAKFS